MLLFEFYYLGRQNVEYNILMYASSIDIFISYIITYTFHKEIFQNHQSSILAVFISCSRHQTLHSNVGTLQTHNGSRYEKLAILFYHHLTLVHMYLKNYFIVT